MNKKSIIFVVCILILSLFIMTGCSSANGGVKQKYRGSYADTQYGNIWVSANGARIESIMHGVKIVSTWYHEKYVTSTDQPFDFNALTKKITFSHNVNVFDVPGGTLERRGTFNGTGSFGTLPGGQPYILIDYTDANGNGKAQSWFKTSW